MHVKKIVLVLTFAFIIVGAGVYAVVNQSIPADNLQSSDGQQELIMNDDGTLSWKAEGVTLGNFSGRFYGPLGELLNLTWVTAQTSENITFEASDPVGNFSAWFTNDTHNGFKYGAKFVSADGLPTTTKVRFNWERNPDATYLVQEERVLIYHKNLSDPYAFYYYDLPQGASIDEDGAEHTFTNMDEWIIDPNVGGTQDGFDLGWTESSDDGLAGVDCTVNFRDATPGGSLTASFNHIDSIDNSGTNQRKPLLATLTATFTATAAVNGVRNSCRFQLFNRTGGGSILAEVLIDGTSVGGGGGTVVQNATFLAINFNFTGVFPFRVNATADDNVGVSGPAVVTLGNATLGIAPYIPTATAVNEAQINFFQRQIWDYPIARTGDDGVLRFRNITWNLTQDAGGYVDFIGNTTTRVANGSSTVSILMENLTTSITTELNDKMFNYTKWGGMDNIYHTRFSQNSQNSSNFNLTKQLQCTVFTSDFPIYNRGEIPDVSGTIRDVNGNLWVSDDRAGRDRFNYTILNETFLPSASGVIQNRSVNFNILAGTWDTDTQIPVFANASFGDFRGFLYKYNFTNYANYTQSSNHNTCIYQDVYGVSKMRTITNGTVHGVTIVNATSRIFNRGEAINETFRILNIRNTSLVSGTGITVKRYAEPATLEETQTGETTDAQGFIQITWNIASDDVADFNLQGHRYWINTTDNGNDISYNNITNGTIVGDFNVSSLLRPNTTVGVNATPVIYNLGEGVYYYVNLTFADGRILDNKQSITARVAADDGAIEDSATETTNSTGVLDRIYNVDPTDKYENNFFGSQKRVRIDWQGNQLSFDGGTTVGSALGVWNVSGLYNVTLFFDKYSYTVGDLFRIYSKIQFARLQPVAHANHTVYILDSTGAVRYTTNYTTNSTGQSVDDTHFALNPTGTWTANTTVIFSENSQNNGTNVNSTRVTLPGQDPLIVTAEGPYIRNETNNWLAVKVITTTGALVTNADPCPVGETCIADGDMSIYIYFPNNTLYLNDTIDFFESSAWAYNMTLNASIPIGTYRAYVNATTNTNDIFAGTTVFQVWDCRPSEGACAISGGGGGLTSDQNSTLYSIKNDTSILVANQSAGGGGGSTTVNIGPQIELTCDIASLDANIRCEASVAYGNSTPFTGAQINFTAISPDNTVLTRGRPIESGEFEGTYSFNFTPTTRGSHKVVVNITDANIEYIKAVRLYAPSTFWNTTQDTIVNSINSTIVSLDSYVRTTLTNFVDTLETTLNSLDTFLRTAWNGYTAQTLINNITTNTTIEIRSLNITTSNTTINNSTIINQPEEVASAVSNRLCALMRPLCQDNIVRRLS